MKNQDYKKSQLKHKLHEMRRAKKKNPIWKLSPEDVEFIRSIGFPIEEYLYEIKTKRIHNLRNAPGIIKCVHYSSVKDHKRYIFKPLTAKYKLALKKYGVYHDGYTYEVFLNRYTGA